jgi:hypothetical protein
MGSGFQTLKKSIIILLKRKYKQGSTPLSKHSKLCKDLGFDVYWYIKYQER